MTTTTRNEAAERLRDALVAVRGWREPQTITGMLDEALAAERRATVERIKARFDKWTAYDGLDILAILDEEAAR